MTDLVHDHGEQIHAVAGNAAFVGNQSRCRFGLDKLAVLERRRIDKPAPTGGVRVHGDDGAIGCAQFPTGEVRYAEGRGF